MRAITIRETGGPENLVLEEVPDPEPSADELLVRIHATAINRADLLQRRGLYPAPPGASPLLGLECAGIVERVGPGVASGWIGKRVMALLAGGGYAEKVAVHCRLVLEIPERLSWVQAAAIPEAFLTAFEALTTLGEVAPSQRVLIHAAGSGVGTAAIQLAVRYGAEVVASAGSPDKLELARSLGALHGINYKTTSRPEAAFTREALGGKVDVILDFVGGRYLERHLDLLEPGGRLVVIGLLGGRRAEIDLTRVLFQRLVIRGLVMRTRPLLDKIVIVARFARENLPLLADGTLRPVIDSVWPWTEAAEAHRRMEANANRGKIVLEVLPAPTRSSAPLS